MDALWGLMFVGLVWGFWGLLWLIMRAYEGYLVDLLSQLIIQVAKIQTHGPPIGIYQMPQKGKPAAVEVQSSWSQKCVVTQELLSQPQALIAPRLQLYQVPSKPLVRGT